MTTSADILPIVNVIVQDLPSIIAFIKSLQAASSPSTPPPTDAQVMAALLQAAVSSITIDEQWKASHPS